MKKDFLLDLLKSAQERTNVYSSTEEIKTWLKNQNETIQVEVNKIPFKKLINWTQDDVSVFHSSGKFFSIEGINIQSNYGSVKNWHQPIINQPEIGYLGFLTKYINDTLHFLCQAKVEPGNVNHVQISPTLQATKSNYTQVHQGKKPLYLDYFINHKSEDVIYDQLQSEQGSRFLKKRNRNIIIRVDEDVHLYDNFIWLTLGQLKDLMAEDNLINMDTRTVLSGIPFQNISFYEERKIHGKLNANSTNYKFLKSVYSTSSQHSNEYIFSKLTHFKSSTDFSLQKIPLKEMESWQINDQEIKHISDRFFKVIAVDVKISNREVINWTQPMIEPTHRGLCAFVCKEIKNVLHFIVQIRFECGNLDMFEFGPTIQTLIDHENPKIPFLNILDNSKEGKIYFDAIQSEEGGRFFKEQNRNVIFIANDDFNEKLPDNYVWMTLNQIQKFIGYSNCFNIQARNLIALIPYG